MSRMPRAAGRAALLALLALPPLAAQPRPLKVYISADMEGVAGVVTADQLGPSGLEYQKFREFMTAEVLAAMRGAKDVGATRIVVSDSHGNGENLLIDQFPDDVTIVRSWPRPLMMMQGIDSSFAAAIFIGYHSATTNPAGVRAHTMSSATLAAVELNGIPVPEAGVNAAMAGAFGVPVVMISGDDAAVVEAQRLLGGLEGAVVKQAISFHAAATLTPQAAQALIQAKAMAGVTQRNEMRPYVVAAPVRLDLTFKNYRPAELLTYLPIVQRVTSHTVRFVGRNIFEVSRFIEFVLNYQSDLAP